MAKFKVGDPIRYVGRGYADDMVGDVGWVNEVTDGKAYLQGAPGTALGGRNHANEGKGYWAYLSNLEHLEVQSDNEI